MLKLSPNGQKLLFSLRRWPLAYWVWQMPQGLSSRDFQLSRWYMQGMSRRVRKLWQKGNLFIMLLWLTDGHLAWWQVRQLVSKHSLFSIRQMWVMLRAMLRMQRAWNYELPSLQARIDSERRNLHWGMPFRYLRAWGRSERSLLDKGLIPWLWDSSFPWLQMQLLDDILHARLSTSQIDMHTQAKLISFMGNHFR